MKHKIFYIIFAFSVLYSAGVLFYIASFPTRSDPYTPFYSNAFSYRQRICDAYTYGESLSKPIFPTMPDSGNSIISIKAEGADMSILLFVTFLYKSIYLVPLIGGIAAYIKSKDVQKTIVSVVFSYIGVFIAGTIIVGFFGDCHYMGWF